jgi:hypothetical protein
LGDAQVGSSGGAHEAPGDVQELVAQLLWFGQSMLARQEEGAGPGEQVDADQGELEPRGVDGELADKRPNPLSFRCGYGPPRARGCGDVPFGIVYGLRMSVRPRPRRL